MKKMQHLMQDKLIWDIFYKRLCRNWC